MSSEYQKSNLGRVLSFTNGRTCPERFDTGIFTVFGSNGQIGKTSKSNSPKNSIIIGRVGSFCGSVHFSTDPCWITDNAIRATVKENHNPFFIFYLLRHLKLNNWRSGSGQPLLNQETLNTIEVSVPSPFDQKAIGLFIWNLDKRIALLRETNTTLEAIAQALFKSWFVDFDPVRAKQEGREPEGMDADTAALFPDSFEESELGLIPKVWTVKCLRDITNRITKGTTPTTLKRPFVASGINFIKVESLTEDGEFIPGKFAYIDNETHELLKRSQLQVDDVLITIAGTIGRIAVMTEDFLPANTNQAVALIRPDPDRFPGGLIKHFLQRDDSRQNMVERVVQAVQANLSLGSISDLKVVVPPSKVVKQLYDAGISQIDACKNRNQKHIRTLTNIRDTLLPRLISGQLRIPEAEALIEEASA